MLVLKIPIAGLLWIVWWAVHQTPDEEPQVDGGDGGSAPPAPSSRRRCRARRGAAPTASAPARPARRRARTRTVLRACRATAR